MITYEFLQHYWWFLIALLGGLLVFLLFVQGGNALIFFAGRNERERELYGYSVAWMHHKGRNRHHFEYWTDFSTVENRYLPVAMPPVYFVEMLCDRISASRVYKGAAYTDRSALDYFMRGQARTRMHPETAALLEGWLRTLAEHGEREAFAEVRRAVKLGKY